MHSKENLLVNQFGNNYCKDNHHTLVELQDKLKCIYTIWPTLRRWTKLICTS